MSYKNLIRVSEFEKLYYDNDKPFKQRHWESMCRYQEQQNKGREMRLEYYRILNRGIQFTNFVGVIQVRNLTIEILPKTDRNNSTSYNMSTEELGNTDIIISEEKQSWHKILLQMLRECQFLQVKRVDYANLALKNNSILDIYLELFLEETESLLREGLVKKYKRTEGNKLEMKGQLDFGKNITQNLVHSERFYVRYLEYNSNNIFNRILYKTLRLINTISSSLRLGDKINRILLDFPDLPDCEVSESTFEKLVYDRKTDRYKKALLISKMLLLNYRPDIAGGSENLIAILFDMNKLWEEFVYRRLKKEETTFNIKVFRQQSEDFWVQNGSHPKTVRPDIVIKRETQDETIIVDTKWKMVDNLVPGDDDLKQMFVYNLFWNCSRSVLLYPSANQKMKSGDYFDYKNKGKFSTKCNVQTINVMDHEKKLDYLFGSKLLDEILNL